jgi:hypothetical protein
MRYQNFVLEYAIRHAEVKKVKPEIEWNTLTAGLC